MARTRLAVIVVVALVFGLAGRDPGDATGTQPLMGSRVRMDDDDGAFALWLYI
jgi:hypothetical protein